MNFLAHIHLSHGHEAVMVGNLVADGYKGKKYLQLPQDLQTGVLLHRKIDHVTDTSAEALEVKHLLRPYLGRYGAVAADIYFDHFLSLHWADYHDKPLPQFVKETYHAFDRYSHIVNTESRGFLEKMVQYNWLLSYADFSKLDLIFRQMSVRTGVAELAGAVQPLQKHYREIEKYFVVLYPKLVAETIQFPGLSKL